VRHQPHLAPELASQVGYAVFLISNSLLPLHFLAVFCRACLIIFWPQVNEVCGLLHHFPEAADEANAKAACDEFIAQAQREADIALDVLQRQVGL
jgi:hypothetical protein